MISDTPEHVLSSYHQFKRRTSHIGGILAIQIQQDNIGYYIEVKLLRSDERFPQSINGVRIKIKIIA